MNKISRTTVLFVCLLLAGIAYAATHFLVSWAFSYDEDASSEFSVTQAYFSKVQSIRMDAKNWKVGDKFTVEYNDGVVAEFPLSARGVACVVLGPCKWVTTVPFDMPTIVHNKRSGLQNLLPSGSTGGISPYAPPMPITSYPIPLPYGQQWSVWVGPLTVVSAPSPPGCRIPCPMLP